MIKQIVTANRLRDGRVVFMTPDSGWSERIADSRCLDAGNESEMHLGRAGDAVADGTIVDPYLIDVTVDSAVPRPVQFRERIRAAGPTIAFGALRDVA